jgi:hypothetical protein
MAPVDEGAVSGRKIVRRIERAFQIVGGRQASIRVVRANSGELAPRTG